MKITFINNAKLFVSVIKTIGSFTSKINIVFKQDGIFIEKHFDNGTGYANVKIDKSEYQMDDYVCDTVFGLDMKPFKDALRIITTLKDVIVLDIKNDEMKVVCKTKKEETSVNIHSECVQQMRLDVDVGPRPVTIICTNKHFDEMFKKVKDSFDGEICENVCFSRVSDTEVGMFLQNVPQNMVLLKAKCTEEFQDQRFCLRMLEPYLKPPAMFKNIRLELLDKYPLRITYPLTLSSDSYVTMFLTPQQGV